MFHFGRGSIAVGLLLAGAALVGFRARQADPELYGAGLFSTGEWDFFMAFSPDQRLVLFCRANDDFSSYQILETRRGADGHWSVPHRPSFAMEWSNADPHISPDAKTVFFISNRPGPGEAKPHDTYDVWSVPMRPDGSWGEPARVGEPVSLPGGDEWSPSVAANGNLYFGSERPGGHGGMDLWVSRFANGRYQPAENLGDSVNLAAEEVEPWIAPDESYLIFSAKKRPDAIGGYDLYISRRKNGVWQQAQQLGGGISSKGSDFNQSVSPDGQWLYFSSTRQHAGPLGERFDSPPNDANVTGIGNGKGDIYRVRMSDLDGGW